MRLSTRRDRDDERGVRVICAALDAGITLLDTADSYCHDEADRGHNERLIARALVEWGGDRSTVTVATKGGLRRHGGDWIPDGRAKAIREACDASRRALGRDTIDLYQLHVVDPGTPLGTSVRALAKLQESGWVRNVGLCNVTVGQIREAQAIATIHSVQVSLGPLDDENLRNGVAEYCRDQGIRLLAYRPLGGERRKALAKDAVLRGTADRHGATPEEVVLAWLHSFGEGIVPLPGATRVESVASIGRSLALRLTDDDRATLDEKYAGTLLRVPRARRRPPGSVGGDVVIVMGMPGAGKSTVARELERNGYERLNRDEAGVTLRDLIPRLNESLGSGKRRVVLDNTYPSRASRNAVIETAWTHGVHARCIWLDTGVGAAQVNAIRRMIEAHGSLPTPEEIKQRSRQDTRYMLPDAQFRYERTVEPPLPEEGFELVEHQAPRGYTDTGENRALIIDLDQVKQDAGLVEAIQASVREGWFVLVHAWRPQVERGELSAAAVEQEFAAMRQALGDVDCAYCPHVAGPPVCWCRKPIPGQVIEFAMRRNVSLRHSMVVGAAAADRTMAERIGARFEASRVHAWSRSNEASTS